MADLWFIRHFRTVWNSEHRLQGRRDIPLAPLDPADRARLARNRAALAGLEFSAILSSPLGRARETAALHGYDGVRIDPDLAELDFGPWEGRTWDELHEAHPGAWAEDPARIPTGESLADFAARVRRVVDRARATDGPPVLCFGHGAWAGCLLALHGGEQPRRLSHHVPGNGALLRLDLSGRMQAVDRIA